MATVKAIKYGMKGDDVTNLQTSLKNAGYNVDVDGNFGPQTLSAVKQYQQANNLTVDGMVGPQTQAKLFGGNANTPAANVNPITNPGATASSVDPGSTTPNVGNPTGEASGVTAGAAAGSAASEATKVNYPTQPTYESYEATPYAESETVVQAQAALDAVLAAQPGAYQSKWQSQLDEMINRILNREKFTYDVNEDALYQQYAEQYQRLGKLAMQDTMGQAAAMTGGYGSSYAQSVGQQAYQGYLQQLNEMVPELYGMALDQYNREGEEMYNRYGLLSDQEQQEYGRYRDSYSDWLTERDYYTGRYDSERDYDYGKYVDDRNFGYQVHTDEQDREWNEYVTAIQNAQWGAEFDETVKQNEIGNQQRETSRQDNLNSETKAYARDEAMAILESGGTPSDELLEAAGMSKETVTALSNAYQRAASSGSGSGTGESSEGSSYITEVEQIEEWSTAVLEAETEEEAMRYIERLEQLDPDLADSLWEDWQRAHGLLGHKITDTTVAVPGGPTGSGRGSGLAGMNNMVK